ncbi:hypothetical protein AXF42_Ash012699 [Apostasia shenzhenica]|uniref:Nitroreductase domain-containing protein n=1 Tax=Apostasia shenzhenica TaxID=1088818 RepID=A0A2H9ZTF3_9ASPA|nr:hypothetical protein AXF42_Ash012699 [Apostasia shenzhenica]
MWLHHSARLPHLPFPAPPRSPRSSPPFLFRPAASAMHSHPSTASPRDEDQKAKKNDEDKLRQAISYHNQTKHSLTSGYARGPGGLDWANQPNPFLRFLSSPQLPLLHLPPQPGDSPLYASLFSSSPPSSPQPISHSTLSRLLYDSLSLSAWKTTGLSTWSLRVNPSSGNLHPTEAHVLCPPLSSLSDHCPFLAHYSPKDHSLEILAQVPLDRSPLAADGSTLFVALCSIFWREAWKYGERAFRYCNHDVGHAIAAVAIAAAALGWDARLLDGLGHDELHRFLGLDAANRPPPSQLPDRPIRGRFPWIESQHPDCLLLLFPFGSQPSVDFQSLSSAISCFLSLSWTGTPNYLSKDHVYWDIIYRTAEAVKKPLNAVERFSVNPFHPSGLISEKLYKNYSVREIVRKRRSAVDMDGVHAMGRDTFFQILLHCLPSGQLDPGQKQGKQFALPFRTMTWDAEVHAALFVHRVKDLPQGLYFLVRNEDHLDWLKMAMRPEFEWVRPEGCPDGLPLYRLARGNCEELAKQLSCHQEIASDGCFSLGMVARFEPILREKNAWMYPRLFWETGVLGQVLYLEAHAIGISATGIGCYFDDDVHKVLGLKGMEFQSLYHFTIGGPVLDRRIMSLPAYPGPGIDA